MRIGMILDRVFPPDIRVEKEIGTLNSAGHEIFLLALARDSGEKTLDISYPGVKVRRIARQSLPARVLTLARFHRTFYNSYWARSIRRLAADFGIEALHVHDLPLARTTIAIARERSIPCIVDLHENYPALMEIWHEDSRGLTRWLAGRFESWRRYEADVLPRADAVIVVAEESRVRLTEQLEVAPDRVTVVMNAEDPERFIGDCSKPPPLPELEDRFIVSYIGGAGRHRGLDVAIDAISELGDRCPKLMLLVVGIEGKARKAAVAQIERLGVSDRVRLVGWIDATCVPAYVGASSACLVPHRKNPQTESGAPHKLFQYMLMGKPVIVSDCAPLKRIVEETEAGLVFPAEDPAALADCMARLYDDPALCRVLGEHGHAAATGPYAWEHQAERLCALYTQILHP